MTSSQDSGRKFEKLWNSIVGGKLIKGSGNQWHSLLDVKSKAILWSLKWTSKRTFTITPELWQEVMKASSGFGGSSAIGALGIQFGKDSPIRLVILDLDDFKNLLEQDIKLFSPDSEDVKREHARVPELLR